MVVISQVREQSLSIACDVLKESAEWLIQMGIPLWNVEDLAPERMLAHVTRGELFLARVDDKPAGTIILQEKDELFWPEIIDGRSLFFHKLAVSRKFAGQGVSNALIEYAYQVAKAQGKTYLRMDCSAQHRKLRPFYESNGFRFLDQKQVGPWFVDRLLRPIF